MAGVVVVVHPPYDSAGATELSLFDRCATYTAECVSKPSFFAMRELIDERRRGPLTDAVDAERRVRSA